MVVAEHPPPVGEYLFEQRDCLVDPPGPLVGAGKVVDADQSDRVAVAEDPPVVGEGLFEQRTDSPLRRPAA